MTQTGRAGLTTQMDPATQTG